MLFIQIAKFTIYNVQCTILICSKCRMAKLYLVHGKLYITDYIPPWHRSRGRLCAGSGRGVPPPWQWDRSPAAC